MMWGFDRGQKTDMVFFITLWCYISVYFGYYQSQAQPTSSYIPLRRGVLLLNSIPPGLRQSVKSSVFAECAEKTISVSVTRDFLGRGQLMKTSDLFLGGCAFGEGPNSSNLFIVSELSGCESRRTMSGDVLVYEFSLVHKAPALLPISPIVRVMEARFGIQCHYIRRGNGSSSTPSPTWISLSPTRPAEEPVFTLRLMTDDWSSESFSRVYFLGDLLHIQASVSLDSHLPLHLFLDSCVATLVPDKNATPRYAFIESKGCLTDAKMLDSKSQFLPRAKDNQLRLLLEAFRFYLDSRTSFYITCYLKLMATSEVGPQAKACSFDSYRWVSVDGNDQVCACCHRGDCISVTEPLCTETSPKWEGEAMLGPFTVLDSPTAPETHSLGGRNPDPNGHPVKVAVMVMVAIALGVACMVLGLTKLYRKCKHIS